MQFFRNISFKFKTILGIALIESLLLALIYFTSINSLNETNENQIQSRAEETSNLISLWVADGLLTFDVGNTEAFISSLVSGDSLTYIHVKNELGHTFAFAGDLVHRDRAVYADNSLESALSDGIYDAIVPVEVDGNVIGSVEIGLPVSELSKFIDEVAYRIKAIAIAEVFLSGLFSWLLGWALTRRLDHLSLAASNIEAGADISQLDDTAKDEIGTVSQAFSKMAGTLIEKEKVLQSNQLKLERVFNSSPLGLVVLMNNGLIGSVNPAFHRILNCHINLNSNNTEYDTFLAAIKTRLNFSDFETKQWFESVSDFTLLSKASTDSKIQFLEPNYRLLEVKIQRIQDDYSGVHSILYFDDMTKTQELERLKSAFLAHAAHELRTPLTSVQGFSEILMMPEVSESERLELAGIINTQSQRVVEMVSQLLDISTIESGGMQALNLKNTDLGSLVEKVVTEFNLPEDREAPLQIFEHDTPNVDIDKDRMYQVILNLVSNAYKYSQQGDQVYINVMPYVGDSKTIEGLDLVVKDTGMGMNEEQVEHIFERFWRADQSGHVPGTGLGMSLVKEIVNRHGAKIFVNSELGQGTEIKIRIFKNLIYEVKEGAQ